ncbi:hypothetical protein [Desulfosporosinus youngiae]|uniref:Uncharacterized protein n=1 Tax=Desulfosporosinus youngiae DSM 17734 TaxID=768710 RepID=H5Y275_9FIRM|nr:hypothetical protein [Desulfosporosinus youngiae]EHQ88273.1 hypothetical protein DesyoDRAFT_1103 [Desulfosporosinus youngiae DSM 17734]
MLEKMTEAKINSLIQKACDGLINQVEQGLIDKESFDAVSGLIEAINNESSPENDTNIVGFCVDPETSETE